MTTTVMDGGAIPFAQRWKLLKNTPSNNLN